MYLLWPPVLKHAIFFFFCLVSCNGSPSYYITTPDNTIPGGNISMAVHWFGDMPEINVTAEIVDFSNIKVSASKVFQNDLIGILTLPAVPLNVAANSYTLVVNGSAQDTLIFSDRTQISVKMKTISVLIQTDKSLYKAGEKVKIRIISVTDLKPYKGDVDLEIRDPGSNIVQQRLSMKSYLGVVSTEFSLSDNTMLGVWNIQATCNGSVNTVRFSVADYVEPRFKLTLDVPSFYIPPKQLNLTGTVTAKSFFGKPLNGSVTIWVKPPYGSEVSTGIDKTYQISGSINFSFTYAEIQNILDWEYLNITASVTEQFTGIVVNESSSVPRVDSEYSLKRVGEPRAFMPGEKFTFQVEIQRIDKKSLTEEERKELVFAKITQFASENLLTRRSLLDDNVILQNYTIPDSAIIDMECLVGPWTSVIQFVVYYKNTTELLSFDRQYGTNPTIRLQISETVLKVGTPFAVQVKTFPTVQNIYYVVLANGTIASAGKSKTTFSLTPDNSWTPTAQLMVYYLNINGTFGDIVQNISQVFSVKTTLGNKVTLSWSKNRAEPSESVSLSISVKESQSLVGLQVVEKTSLLLQDRNDITASRIEELYTRNQSSLTSLTNAIVYSWYGYDKVIPEAAATGTQQYIFPETWIWKDTNISSSLTTTFEVSVPNKNTTWVATAFVISEGLGLGVTDIPMEISVVQPLVTILNLPFSLTRGEQCILGVNLFNSLKEDLEVLVTLESSNSFDIIAPINNTSTVPGQYKVTVQSEAVTTVLFPINPKKLGSATFKVTVTSKAASEVLTKTMLVKAEGLKFFYSQSALFDLIGSTIQSVSKNFSFTFPSDVIRDTMEGSVTVVGDLIAPSLNGLESLIMMPYGCGEQNMINLAPNIYILVYLIATKQSKPDITERCISYMENGYQRELTYKRKDGSFSAFGDYDISGSTWLTAFVFKCFLQARSFIYINSDVLDQAVEWLVKYQDESTGVFSEPGRVIHTELQGGQNGPTTLTAYIVTCLLEDVSYSQRYAIVVDRAVKYLESIYDAGITSNYTLSVVVYALSLAKSNKAGAALDQLNSRASITGSAKYWSAPSVQTYYYWQPRTTDIETAAYALLSCYHQGKFADGILVMKWLSEQRNQLGGYVSTQDTVMALQALSQFVSAANFGEGATSLKLTMTGSGSFVPKTFQINSSNLLVLQRQQIEVSQPLLINVVAEGTGLAISQLNLVYNQKTPTRAKRDSPVPEAFKLDVTVKEDPSNIYKLSVDICTSYLGIGSSGMVLIDMGYLSGFELSPIGIPTGVVDHVETKSDRVYLYLNSVSSNQICISVPLIRVANVASSQDAIVTIQEYYNPRNAATRSYNSETMKKISYCDFCGLNCTQCRSNVDAVLVPETPENNVTPESNAIPPSDSSTKPMFHLMCLYIILISYLL